VFGLDRRSMRQSPGGGRGRGGAKQTARKVEAALPHNVLPEVRQKRKGKEEAPCPEQGRDPRSMVTTALSQKSGGNSPAKPKHPAQLGPQSVKTKAH